MEQVEEDGVVERWGGVGRWKNEDGAMPDGNSEMVRVVSLLEGEPEEDQGGDDRSSGSRSGSGRNVGSKGCGRESKGVCGSLEGPRKVRVRPPEPLPTLRQRRDSGGELRRPLKKLGWVCPWGWGCVGRLPSPESRS